MQAKTNNTSWLKKVLILSLIIILLILGNFIYSSYSSKNEVIKNLNNLKSNQEKLESLNTKYKEDNTNKYNEIKDKINNNYLPWEISKISKNIDEINTNNLNLYNNELNSIKLEFGQSLEAWKTGITNDKDFAGKNEVLEDLKKLNNNVNNITNSKELEAQKTIFNELQDKYKTQLETYNKKALIDGLKAGQADIDSLLVYFKKYPELSESLKKVEKYKTEIEFYSSNDTLSKFTFQSLEDKLNNEIRPLLSDAIKAKSQNEEKIRLQTQAQNNTTNTSDAPIKSGKLILVNKTKQRMYIYENGVLIRENPVTTGRTNWPTDAGTYSVLTKERNRRLVGSGQGATWNVFVKYWMLFNASEEEGIHDASWRNGNFGGPDFVTNGSRGCINTPDETMEWLFNWAPIGTPVVIQD
jgi:lipoprotein-anchoring transpeptidase ErfK/SrfK